MLQNMRTLIEEFKEAYNKKADIFVILYDKDIEKEG